MILVDNTMNWVRFAFVFCLMAIGNCAIGQNLPLIDSLRSQLAIAKPAVRFGHLNTIGFEYRNSIPDSAIIYCKRAYDLGKELGLTKQLSKPLSFIGLAHANKGDYKQSLFYHYQAIEVAIEQNDSLQLAHGYNNLGRMFFDGGDMGRAFDNLIRAKVLFETLKDKSGLAYVYRSLASLYKAQKNFSEALEMSTRALELRKQIGEPRPIVSAFMELGLVYYDMNDLQQALAKFAFADSIASKINDPLTRAELSLGIAEILYQQNEYEKAFNAANKVLMGVSERANQKIFLRASIIRAKYYFHQQQYAEAIPILEKIVTDAENSGISVFQRDALFVLSEIHQRKNNFLKAEEFKHRHQMLNEKIQNTDLTRQVERLQFQLEIEKKEKENELLKANREKDLAHISNQKFQNIFLVIIIIIVSIGAFFLWKGGQRRKLINSQLELKNKQVLQQGMEIAEKNEHLSARNKELSDLNHEKDTLMNIVAHDLKSPLNRIFGLARLIEMEGSGKLQKEYVKLIKDVTRSGLDLITDLLDVSALEEATNGPTISMFDLSIVMEDRINFYQVGARNKDIQLILLNVSPGSISSDPDYISRILDNLLSNAIKFSPKGSTVVVNGEVKDHRLVLSVKDQGPGISQEDRIFIFQKFKKLSARPTGGESSNGLGLAIVKTLVDRLHGEIELRSENRKGSEFLVKIPVKVLEKVVI